MMSTCVETKKKKTNKIMFYPRLVEKFFVPRECLTMSRARKKNGISAVKTVWVNCTKNFSRPKRIKTNHNMTYRCNTVYLSLRN